MLAQLAAAASVTADRALAIELATEAEQAARERPRYDTWGNSKEYLARALVRLGRLDAPEGMYRASGVPALLRADMALAHSRSSPADTLRLLDGLDGLDDQARWRDPNGQPLEKITNADLVKASAVLEDLQPYRAAALVDRAIGRARGRTQPRQAWGGAGRRTDVCGTEAGRAGPR
ncbi:hypothetical protein [Streptomyces sp. NPDC002088]|uniref:hypothetical protein n=1 Tax=Streptomyces sp. NPDC002088 TaxID=3154665 RepID=UPI00333438C2